MLTLRESLADSNGANGENGTCSDHGTRYIYDPIENGLIGAALKLGHILYFDSH